MKKTNNKWNTGRCDRCFEAHENYTGKIGGNGREYVICGVTQKKIYVDRPKDNWHRTVRIIIPVGGCSEAEAKEKLKQAKQSYQEEISIPKDVLKMDKEYIDYRPKPIDRVVPCVPKSERSQILIGDFYVPKWMVWLLATIFFVGTFLILFTE